MENEIVIIEKEIGNVIELEERAPVWKMPFIMGKDYKQIFNYLESQNCECAEAPYTRYLDINWQVQISKGGITNFFEMFTKKWHFQVGVPTSKKLDGKGNLNSLTIGNRKYVMTFHYGPYQKVGQTYKRIFSWIKEKNLTPENESIEIYLNDPQKTKKKDLKTTILIPLTL